MRTLLSLFSASVASWFLGSAGSPELPKQHPDPERWDDAGRILYRQLPERPGPESRGIDNFFADSFYNDLSGLGKSNDKGSTAQIITDRPRLVEDEINNLCRNDGIAQRIVCKVVDDATARGWYCRDHSDDPDPMADEDRRLAIPAVVNEAAMMGRKHGNGFLLLICTDDGVSPGSPDWWNQQAKPLNLGRLKKVHNMVPLDTLQCVMREWDADSTSLNFMNPVYYTCSATVANTKVSGLKVHYSRIIRFTGIQLTRRERLQYRGLDLSVLQPALDALAGAAMLDASARNFVQEFGTPVLKSPMLVAETAGARQTAFNLMMRGMAMTKSLLNMILLASDEEFVRSSPSITGFKDLDERSAKLVCAMTGYSYSELWLTVPGGFGKEDKTGQDSANQRTQNFQIHRLRDPLQRIYEVLYAQKDGPTGGKIPKRWSVEFHSLQVLSDADKLALQKTAAEVDEKNIKNGIYSAQRAWSDRYSEGGFSADLQAGEWEAPAPVVVPDGGIDVGPGRTAGEAGGGVATNPGDKPGQKSFTGSTPPDAEATGKNPGVPGGRDEAGTLPPGANGAAVEAAKADVETPPGVAGKEDVVADADRAPVSGLPKIVLEYEAGEIRCGIAEDGTAWESPKLPGGYGYFEDIPGLDGDEADCIQMGPWSGTTFIIEHRYQDGSLDEHKCVVGVNTVGEALNAYSMTYGPAANYGRVFPVPDDMVVGWLNAAMVWEEAQLTLAAKTGVTPEAEASAAEAGEEELRKVALWHGMSWFDFIAFPREERIAMTLFYRKQATQDSEAGLNADGVARYSHINFTPPIGVADEARKGLEWRRNHGRGGTGVGVARARDLSNRATISPQTIRRMRNYFTRHQGDKRGKGYTPGAGYPSAGRVAWALWGGDPGRAWAEKVWRQMQAADKA